MYICILEFKCCIRYLVMLNLQHDYFAKLGAPCAHLNILTKSMQIFIVDEVGVSIIHKPGKVFTEIGQKNVWMFGL